MKESKQLHAKELLMRIFLGGAFLALLVGLTFIAVWVWRDEADNPLFFLLTIGWFLGILAFVLVVIPEKFIHLLYWLRSKCAKHTNDETFEDLVVSEDLAIKKRRTAVIFTLVFSIVMFGIAIVMGII